ncbi:MAG: TonB-dependent receptor plug domain-containing protein [Bacteroidota bacterium]
MMLRLPQVLGKSVLPFFFSFLFLFCYSPFLFSQFGENEKHDKISGKLRSYSTLNGPEKLYVLSDKSYYKAGEVIWFKTYLVNGVTHQKSEKSNVIYVDLLNQSDSVIIKRRLYAEGIGASGDIKTDEDFVQGKYRLRAYTKYMLNDDDPPIFEKSVFISNKTKLTKNLTEVASSKNSVKEIGQKPNKIFARFFPEGGNMLSGVQNILGFEIKDETGKGISADGMILEENGTPVSFFRSHDFGLGIVNFTPEVGKKYYAQVEHDNEIEKFALPDLLETGYMLNIRSNGDHLLILASSTIKKGLEDAFLVGHLRGNVFFEKRIKKVGRNKRFTYKLNTARLSNGVAHFTLFDKKGEPLCERLVFIHNENDDLSINISTSKINIGHRDEFEVGLDIRDNSKNQYSGEVSMSVFKLDDKILPEQKKSDIKTWMLLNSDLGGTIPYASYFFENNSDYRKRLLDALMLTHGWRRFVWKDFLADSVSKEQEFKPEKGIMIKGTTTSSSNKYQPFTSQVKLSFMGKEIHQEVKLTDNRGKFVFGPFFFRDTLPGVVETVTKNKFDRKQIKIYLESTDAKVARKKSKNIEKQTFNTPVVLLKETKSEEKKTGRGFKIGSKVKRLKEVRVFGSEKTKRQLVDEEIKRYTALYSQPSNRVYIDSFPELIVHSALDYLRRFPGVKIIGRYPTQSVVFQGQAGLTANLNGNPLFLFDGAPVTADFAASLTANEVMFIDILKGADATLFGVRGANGVIAIYGKRGVRNTWSTRQSPGVADFNIPGFYKTREFYSPDYSIDNPNHKNPDNRTTLHWEPDIYLDGNKKVSLKQFTGDVPGEYMIKVEGMTYKGQPVFNVSRITVGDKSTRSIE